MRTFFLGVANLCLMDRNLVNSVVATLRRELREFPETSRDEEQLDEVDDDGVFEELSPDTSTVSQKSVLDFNVKQVLLQVAHDSRRAAKSK